MIVAAHRGWCDRLMSVLSALRERTRADHLRLEAQLPMGRPGLTLVQYLGYVRVMHATTCHVERALLTVPGFREAVPDHARRVKAPALDADLGARGAARDREREPVRAPEVRTVGEAMGVAYVLEGATLGGAVIARNVEATLGPETPMRYLRVYGDELGAMWRTFCGALEAFAAREGHGEVCASASATFRALGGAFAAEGLVA
jgi:heme oxygenase